MKPYFHILATFLLFLLQSTYGQNPLKIMPLGNSITQGWTDGSLTVQQMKSYRYDLKQFLQNAGYNIDFVGSEMSGSAFFSDCQHAGIGGSRDQYVARLLEDGYDARHLVQILNPPKPYLDEYNPDIILLHIGTNDVTHEADLITNQKVSYILDLIDQYEVRSNREVIVFLGLIMNRKKPWIAGSGAATTSDFNNAIKAMAQLRITAGDKLLLVDMEHDAGFFYDDRDMADAIHPNAAGYTKMADLWYDSIIANYNMAPVITDIPDQQFDEGGSIYLSFDNYITDMEDHDTLITWTITPIGSPKLNFILNETSRQLQVSSSDSDWYGIQTVVFTASDRGKRNKYIKTISDTVIFTVNDVNDPPLFISNPVITIKKGEIYNYAFSAIDNEQMGELVYSIENIPDWLSFYANSKLLVGIPPQCGEFSVVIRASDGYDETEQSFNIIVTDSISVSSTGDQNEIYGVYPNPAFNYVKFLLPEKHAETKLIIFDLTGKAILKKSFCADCEPIIYLNQENLSSGIYFYRIQLNKNIFTGKLLIKR